MSKNMKGGMKMAPIYALTVLIAIFALGEIVAEKTKAFLSTTLVIALVLLGLFWAGLPANILNYGAISAIGMNLVGILIAGIGNMMDFSSLKKQWKTALISLLGVISGVALIMGAGTLILGRYMAISGAPIFAGTNAATLIMIDVLNERGMEDLITFIILILVSQNFIGIPLASISLRKEAKRFLQNKKDIEFYAALNDDEAALGGNKKILSLPNVLQKPSGVFTRLAIVASISFWLAGLTNGHVHFLVMSLIMGIVFTELGFLEKNALMKTHAFGFIVFVTTVVIFSNLADTTPQMLLNMIGPLLITLGIGVLGVGISSLIMSKLLKVSPFLALAMGLTCTFGFPTTLLMPREVAEAVGGNEQEKEAIRNYLTPNMVTAGFVGVTIASVFIAGFAASIL